MVNCCIEIIYSQQRKSRGTYDNILNERENKYVTWVMGHSNLVPEHNTIFPSLVWFCCHGIAVSHSNHSLSFKFWRWRMCDVPNIMTGYLQ